ncbi:MAG TPA: hypothetical protein VMZ52_07290 [Bryobacteraceae bacterium]|nr:hypothetical protein [Bryobacteraceae bacterium]
MKYCALLLFSAGLCCAAEFTTGQAARLIIGQENFTRQKPGAESNLLGGVSGIAIAGDRLFVVDSNRVQASPQNNRILIFNGISSTLPAPKAVIPSDSGRCPICVGNADAVVGQPDFTSTGISLGGLLSEKTLRTPTAVASDGRILVIADTDNNRVLIWNSIPTTNGVPANVVVGQPDFKTATLNFGGAGSTPSAKGLRGPQGVWLQNGKLYVADTQNHRVVVWNQVPTANGQPADLVLGQANFTTFVEADLARAPVNARANNMLNPVSVTSDGTRLFVTDLGHNRVLVWNSIPTQNQAAADIVLGQPEVNSTADLNYAAANNSKYLCPSNGVDDKGAAKYPERCSATLDFPRYALSDGKRFFIADGGNDRILVYNSIPTRSGQPADVILGQPDDLTVQGETNVSGADSVRTPMSLGSDGTNLFVSDPFNRRVLVFTPGDTALASTGVRNSASQEIFAVGAVSFSGTLKEGDEATIKIADKSYTYKVVKDDSIARIITAMVGLINADSGNGLVFAIPNINFSSILLTSRVGGEAGNTVALAVSTSTGAVITLSSSGAFLAGGQNAAKIAPGTLVTLLGTNFTSQTAAASASEDRLPKTLGGVQVYFDGIRAPLLFVSPTQINAQIPFEIYDANSVSAYVRSGAPDGSVSITTAVAVPVVQQNPGIFAEPGTDPRRAIAFHGSSFATGTISVDGGIKAGDVATVTIADRSYSYTITAEDNLASVRDRLIAAINDDPDVTAFPAGIFTRIRLRSKVAGKNSEGLAYSAKTNDSSSLILTALSNALCCANTAGARITDENPAVPGETIIVYATGLGLVQPDEAKFSAETGRKYFGPELNYPNTPVDDSLAGGKTANVLAAGLKPGSVGVYELQLQLNTDIPTNPLTQLTIAQDVFVSNIVTFPVFNANAEVAP